MKKLHEVWHQLASKYAALSQRERWLVAAAAVLGPVLLGNALFIDPSFSGARNLRRTIEQQQLLDNDLKMQAQTLQVQVQVDPDATKKQELAVLKQRVESADERLKKLRDTLVAPSEMNALLERVLAKHAGLRLVSLKTLAPESIIPLPAGAEGKPAPARQLDIYRHGIELRLEGSYLELLAYVDQLEKADKKIIWGPMQFSVIDHPRSQLTVTVYTLGFDRTWLSI